MKFRPLRVVGVMTGTSCDGLDASCLEFRDAQEFRVLWNESRTYAPRLRERVLAVQKPGTSIGLREMMDLEVDLGRWYARVLSDMIRTHPLECPDAICNHGQTIGHFPNFSASWQAGEPAEIAFATGITVISHLRQGDLAAHGDGAPIVPAFHRVLAKRLDPHQEGLAIHNLGGVSNLTYVGPEGQVIAFDTGPANFWIDAAMSKLSGGRVTFDRDGETSRSGKADFLAVKKILTHSYFKRSPPKSTGRDEFPFQLLTRATRANGKDLVATATEITVESIAQAYEKFIVRRGLPLAQVLICGGGEKNLFLLERLQQRLPQLRISGLSQHGFAGQYTEAQAFAYLGWRTLLGLPLGGSWTGAKEGGPPGRITPGANWSTLARLLAANPIWAEADSALERGLLRQSLS